MGALAIVRRAADRAVAAARRPAKSVNAALGAWAGWLEQVVQRRRAAAMATIAWLVAAVPAAVAGALHCTLCSTRCTRCSRSPSTSPRSTSRSASASSAIISPAIQLAIKSGGNRARADPARRMARRLGRGAHARGDHPPGDRGSAARFPPPRVRRASVGMCCCPGRAARSSTPWRRSSPRAAGPRLLRPFRAAGRSTCSTGRQYG